MTLSMKSVPCWIACKNVSKLSSVVGAVRFAASAALADDQRTGLRSVLLPLLYQTLAAGAQSGFGAPSSRKSAAV